MNVEPTHVFGQGAADYKAAKGWVDTVVIDGLSLNPKEGADGRTEQTARDIVMVPGEYRAVDGFKAAVGRPWVTVRCIETERPKLVGSDIESGKARRLNLFNLELIDTSVGANTYAAPGEGVTAEQRVQNCYLHSWKRYHSGISGDHEQCKIPVHHIITDNVFDNVGSPSNLRHGIYIGTRAGSKLNFERNKVYGGRNSSQLKSKCNENLIRHNEFHTHPMSGPGGMTAHSMIDIPACCRVIMSHNELNVWKGPSSLPQGYEGLMTPPIHWRARNSLDASDIPAYPREQLWPYSVTDDKGNVMVMKTPGKLAYTAIVPPAPGWSPDWPTWMDEEFWKQVAAWDVADPNNPFTYWFQKFISQNVFRYVGDSLEKAVIRDNGTWPASEWAEGSGDTVGPPIPVDYRERSVTFMCANEVQGNWLDPELTQMQTPRAVCDGYRTRTQPWHFPRVVNVQSVLVPQIPVWFPQ